MMFAVSQDKRESLGTTIDNNNTQCSACHAAAKPNKTNEIGGVIHNSVRCEKGGRPVRDEMKTKMNLFFLRGYSEGMEGTASVYDD